MGERARAAVPRKTPKVRLTRPGRSPPATAPAPAAPAPAGDGAPAVDAAGPDLRDMSDGAAARAAELEARLRELCDGYERLNRLALEAPLGLAAAARSHRAKPGGDAVKKGFFNAAPASAPKKKSGPKGPREPKHSLVPPGVGDLSSSEAPGRATLAACSRSRRGGCPSR